MDYVIGGTGTGYTIKVQSKDGKDLDYEKKIVAILSTIEGTTVGKILLNAINTQNGGKQLSIRPRVPSSAKAEDVCVAAVYTVDQTDEGKRKAVGKLKSMQGDPKDENPKMPWYSPDDLGTGEGADCYVTFVPGVWADTEGSVCRAPGSKFGGPGSDPDTILFHELVHCYRVMTGSQVTYRITVDNNTDQKYEEFLAILIANIFMSDRKDALLRSFNHREVSTLIEPDKFLGRNKNRTIVEGLCKDLVISPLLNELGKVACAFNPIRDVKVAASTP